MRAVLSICTAIGMVLCKPINADDQEILWGDAPLLATVSNVRVVVTDQVSGGCFTNAAAAKDAVELVFRRNGLKVTDDPYADLFEISVLGRRLTADSGANLGCSAFKRAKPSTDRGGRWNNHSVASSLSTSTTKQRMAMQLVEKLAEIGVKDTEVNVRNKIARGGFTAVFFLQCLLAIGCQTLRIDSE